MRVVLLGAANGFFHRRVRKTTLNAHDDCLVLLVAHDDAMERTLRHLEPLYSFDFAFARDLVFAAVLGLLAFGFLATGSASAFGVGSGIPARFCAAIVLMRAMSRRIVRTREVFSSCPVARWKRRLNCSFFSLSTSSSS